MIRDTSLLAYIQIKEDGRLSNSQLLVFDTLKRLNEPVTATELSKIMDCSINRITPRLLELRHKNKIRLGYVRKCRITGENAHVHIIKNGD